MSLKGVCVPVLGLCINSREFRTMPPPVIRKAPGQESTSNAIVGLEVEVEGLAGSDFFAQAFWNITSDGSLRNHGLEFISVPLRSWELSRAFSVLNDLFEAAGNNGGSPDFSWRTSTHVHLNVRDLMLHQAGALGLLEILFSRMLFDFIKRDREKSNFCIPNISRRSARNVIRLALADHPACQELFKMPADMRHVDEIQRRFVDHVPEFSKYSSLNFLPIRKLGTLEYRHFHGCNEEEKLRIWIAIITRMYDFVSAEDFDLPKLIEDIRRLNTKSNYIELTREVFGPDLGSMLIKQADGSLDSFLKVGCFKSKQLLFDSPNVRVTRSKSSFVGAKGFFAAHIKEEPKKVTKKLYRQDEVVEVSNFSATPIDPERVRRAAHDGILSTEDDPEFFTENELGSFPMSGFFSLFDMEKWVISGNHFVPVADPVTDMLSSLAQHELWILRCTARERIKTLSEAERLGETHQYNLNCRDWEAIRARTMTCLGRQYRSSTNALERSKLAITYALLSREQTLFATSRARLLEGAEYPWSLHFQRRDDPFVQSVLNLSPVNSL